MSNVLCKDTVVVWWNEGETEPTESASATEATTTIMQQEYSDPSGVVPGVPTSVAIRQGTVSHSYTVPSTSRSITFACEANTGVFDPWTLILGFTVDTRAARIRAKVQEGNFGRPLHVFSDGSYMALWSGHQGIALYVFEGYSITDYPTQTITLEAGNPVITF